MKIRIRKDAASIYAKKFTGTMIPRWKWYETLKAIEGMTLEVETQFLFEDQYNTVPIPGISDFGLRIMKESVEEVIDDERQGKSRCLWCGKPNEESAEVCIRCGHKEYMEPFRRNEHVKMSKM